MRGKVDGVEVYLDEGQLPAFTFSVASLTDPTKVQGTRSTTIRILSTPQSRRALGSEHMARVYSSDRPSLRIGDGDASVFSADVVPVKHSRDVIECLAVGGNASWFDLAKGLKLRDADLGNSDVVTGPMQQATWADDTGILFFPLVQFGGGASLRPAVRAYNAIERIMADWGWTVKAAGRFADVARRLIVLEPKATPGVPIPVAISPMLGASSFTASADGVASVTFGGMKRIGFDLFNHAWDGVFFRVHVYDFTASQSVASWDTPRTFAGSDTYGDISLDHDFTGVPVISGHQYAVAIEVIGADGVILPTTPDMLIDWDSGAQTLQQQSDNTHQWNMTEGGIGLDYAPGARVHLARCLPDWTLADLISQLAILVPLTMDTDPRQRTITMAMDGDYFRVSPSTSRDWRGRMNHTSPPERGRNVGPSSIAMRYATDTGDREVWRKGFTVADPPGWANADVVLPGVAAPLQVHSKFAATVNGIVSGLSVPVLTDRAHIGVDNFARTTRILIFDGMADGAWELDGSTLSQYPHTYFSHPAPLLAMPFGNAPGDALNLGWQHRIRRMTADTLTAYFHLRDTELQNFDFGMPTLVDDGSGPAWYWVQEIRDHRFGAGLPTKVTLVKIPGLEYQAPANPPVVFPDPPQPVPPFVCEGPGTASIVVAPGGGTKLFVSQGTSTHFTVRGPSQTFTWPINAPDGIDIGEGSWCIYASDADGNPGGSIYDLQIGMFTENDIMSVDLSRMNDLRDVYMIEIETAATFAPFNADLENISISGAALISVLPSFGNVDGLQSFSIDNMAVLSALPDFSPDALATFFIQSCQSLASIGTLPMINQLDIADTGITDPAVVDALVNALHPASGGIATFNGLLSLRTSASDTNYNACISAGWTII